MLKANSEAMAFLRNRRSRPAKTLTAPAPDRDALMPLLEAAARVPDHGMLVPWRFVVLEGAALARIAAKARARAVALGLPEERQDKLAAMFADAPLMVAVIARPAGTEKVPEVEQILSTGAVCLSLLNAALASGWGANWLTGILALDPAFLLDALKLSSDEFVAAYMVIGTETSAPPERKRPDLGEIVDWVDA